MKATLTHSAQVNGRPFNAVRTCELRHDMVAGMKLSRALRRAGKQHIATVNGSPCEQRVDLLARRDRHLR